MGSSGDEMRRWKDYSHSSSTTENPESLPSILAHRLSQALLVLTSSICAHMPLPEGALTCSSHTHPPHLPWYLAARANVSKRRKCLGPEEEGKTATTRESKGATAGRWEGPGTMNQEGSFCFSVSVHLSVICLILFGDKPPNEKQACRMAWELHHT